LDEVHLSPSPDVDLLTLDGNLLFEGESWSTRDLRIRAAGTDVVILAASDGRTVSGSLKGTAPDANALWSWAEHFREPRSPRTEPDFDDPREGGVAAEIDITLDALRAGRSEARNLRAKLRSADGQLTLSSLEFDTYEGHISGWVLSARERLELSLDIRDVTGRFLDDLLFSEKPRGIRGVSAILQPIPIAGDALKVAHIRLLATGSPYDMRVTRSLRFAIRS